MMCKYLCLNHMHADLEIPFLSKIVNNNLTLLKIVETAEV